MPTNTPDTPEDNARDARGLTDQQAAEIAERLVKELREPPPATPGDRLLAQQHELPPELEARVEAALVERGVVPPETTEAAQREPPEPDQRRS